MVSATPRRLFMSPAGSARKRSAPGTAMRSKFGPHLAKVRVRSTPKRMTVKKLIQKVAETAQEKKRQESPLSVGTKRSWTEYLIGSDIAPAAGSFNRIGGHITVTGVSVKGSFQNLNGVAPGAPASPLILKMYLVTTDRSDSPRTFWFQDQNNDRNIAYNDPLFTNDPAGDRLKMRYRLNLQDMKILKKAQYKVYPRLTDGVNNKTIVSINWYKKLDVKFHYNVPPAQAIPYSADAVRPNIWLCYFLENPDVGSVDANMFGNAQFTCVTYFRE